MADALRHLADACEGDGRPDCPIIKGLETGAGCDAATTTEPPAKGRVGQARA
jgi:MerR family gold-responsive transcriptional activator of gol and ges genes